MSYRIVVSLGGNALGYEPENQLEAVKKAADVIVELYLQGNEILICHGNGPQVGLVNLAFEYASDRLPMMPFPECGAMTQGYIGYHLQQAINNGLVKRGHKGNCLTVLSEVLVDRNDEAFFDPSKPIGDFYSQEEAQKRSLESGQGYKEDAGRGYRRVVASPKPVDILQIDAIRALIKDHIVICCGGGGIPVIEEDGDYKGIAAVIDKDRSSSLLAKMADADLLMILTAVDEVCLNYRKENEVHLARVSVDELQDYMKEDHFAKGSMYPKVEACIGFVKERKKKAIITSPALALKALNGEAGTLIEP